MFKKIFTVCCILALLVSLSTAQGEEKKAVEMEEMVVKSTKIEQKLEHLTDSVTIIGEKEIDQPVVVVIAHGNPHRIGIFSGERIGHQLKGFAV